ncbi:Short-chain dehydrogenase/reductase family 16C member 6-like protein [Leptotrombidium deliense]|uniref:Short-chain dehydrogenase/reductase 3 n=1 Tax=Leptotrombidium deliense TaxID=299467 RepID=A0A443SHV9_9ACAR|nr:Short-chain dehydrogenase/reductase family 16C member 6-like protein [Leptotrombidium deliense]
MFSDLFWIFYLWSRSIVLFFIPKSLRLKDVSKDTVLITGASRGLGRLLAIKFAPKVANVIICGTNEDGLNETKKLITESGGTCHSYVCDVSKRSSIEEMASKIYKEVGSVTILVNNAGIVNGKKFEELKAEEIEKVFQVNVLSHFWTCKAFLPSMIKSDYGHIVCISSMAGIMAVPTLTDYCSSKFAALGFFESLYTEYKPKSNVNFTAVCCALVNTGMFAGTKSEVVPVLEPEYAADEIMKAMLTNQETLILPKMLNLVTFLKAITPLNVSPYVLRLFKGDKTMDSFVGHTRDDFKKD